MKPTSLEGFALFVEYFQKEQKLGHYANPKMFAIGRYVKLLHHVFPSAYYPVLNFPGQSLGTLAVVLTVLGDRVGILPGSILHAKVTSKDVAEMLEYFQCFEGDGKPHLHIDLLKEIAKGGEEAVATFIFDVDARESVEFERKVQRGEGISIKN